MRAVRTPWRGYIDWGSRVSGLGRPRRGGRCKISRAAKLECIGSGPRPTGAEVRLEPLDHTNKFTHILLLTKHGVSFVTEAGMLATPSLPFLTSTGWSVTNAILLLDLQYSSSIYYIFHIFADPGRGPPAVGRAGRRGRGPSRS